MFLRNRDLDLTEEEYHKILFDLGILVDEEDWKLFQLQELKYDYDHTTCYNEHVTTQNLQGNKMITIETKITLNIDGNTLSLTKEQAEDLYKLLHQELGKITIPAFDPNKLYPRGITFGKDAYVNEITTGREFL